MKSKGRNSILKKIIGTLCIPVVTLLVMILLCQRNGVVFFESEAKLDFVFPGNSNSNVNDICSFIESEFRKI